MCVCVGKCFPTQKKEETKQPNKFVKAKHCNITLGQTRGWENWLFWDLYFCATTTIRCVVGRLQSPDDRLTQRHVDIVLVAIHIGFVCLHGIGVVAKHLSVYR